jgi:hypothetical protein
LILFGCSSAPAPGAPSTDASATKLDGGPQEASATLDASKPKDAATEASATMPAGCSAITLKGPLVSLQLTNPEQYSFSPDLSATVEVDGSTGDAENPNRLTFYLDGADAVGTYEARPYSSAYYALGNGGAIHTDYVPATTDSGTSSGAFAHRYMAVSGSIAITESQTPFQTTGRLSNIRFEEAVASSDGTISVVSGGKCYWLAEADWNTIRPHACMPFAPTAKGPCEGEGHYCMPTNAIGTDGLCVTTGGKGLGESCTLATTGKWDSDCSPGLRCAEFAPLDTSYTCHSVCNVRSSTPGCPDTAHCGGGYETCIPNSFLDDADGGNVEGNEIDLTASVGDACSMNPSALYCGANGTPGTCFQNTGSKAAMCSAWALGPSLCGTQSTGYVAYKSGIDESTLFCFH